MKGQNERQRMDTLMGLRVALNSWAAVPKDKVIGRSVIGTRHGAVTDGAGWGKVRGKVAELLAWMGKTFSCGVL